LPEGEVGKVCDGPLNAILWEKEEVNAKQE